MEGAAMSRHKDIVVGGLGNPLMTDEGIGCYVVRELSGKVEFSGSIDFVELGTSFINVVHAIAGRKKVVLVDCAFMNETAGMMRRFVPDDIISRKTVSPFSIHEGSLLDVLKLSKKLGECPKEVVIYGIEPEIITAGNSLSPSLQDRLSEYVATIGAELLASSHVI